MFSNFVSDNVPVFNCQSDPRHRCDSRYTITAVGILTAIAMYSLKIKFKNTYFEPVKSDFKSVQTYDKIKVLAFCIRTPEPNKNIIVSVIPFSIYNSSSSVFQQAPPSGHYIFPETNVHLSTGRWNRLRA